MVALVGSPGVIVAADYSFFVTHFLSDWYSDKNLNNKKQFHLSGPFPGFDGQKISRLSAFRLYHVGDRKPALLLLDPLNLCTCEWYAAAAGGSAAIQVRTDRVNDVVDSAL